MKKAQPRRPYNMTVRAEQVAQNEERILMAVVSLWKDHPIQDITLERVAEKAGVTIRTVLRKYGSKEGLLEATLRFEIPGFKEQRERHEPGDVAGALAALIEEYEEMGDAVVRTIRAEDELPFAAMLLERGRQEHRKWCARVFAPYLPDPCEERYGLQLSAFIAATEIYLWKLLRRDLGHTREEVLEIFTTVVKGIINRITL